MDWRKSGRRVALLLGAAGLVAAGAVLKTGYDAIRHMGIDHLDHHVSMAVVNELRRRDPSIDALVQGILRDSGVLPAAVSAPEPAALPEVIEETVETQEEQP